MDAPLVGRTLGHFRVTGAIGTGGMGVVYKATDLRLRRTVALKVLPPELARDPERRSRLLAEARAASALNHPHIVTVHEIDSADGTDFIAMEYLEGRSLDRVIGRTGSRWKGPEAIGAGGIMTRLRTALAAAFLATTPATAQDRDPDPQPTCKSCPASHIASEEIQAYLKRARADRIIDQQVRAVDIGKSNVAIGLVHRTKLSTPGEVAEHDLVSEVYHVISGRATLVTGPEMEGLERRPATNTNVRLLNGPGHNARSVRNGISHPLKAGDVIVIPAGTGHWFTKIDDHITYLMIRIDPDKVAPLKDEAASKADLAGRK